MASRGEETEKREKKREVKWELSGKERENKKRKRKQKWSWGFFLLVRLDRGEKRFFFPGKEWRGGAIVKKEIG